MRLVQLLNLPQADPTSQSVPEEEGERGMEGFLSLNVTELTNSLATLPLSVRLDLPPQLLERYGVRDLGSLQEESLPHGPLTPEGDLQTLLSREISKTEFDFSATPEKRAVAVETPLQAEVAASDSELDTLLLSAPVPQPLNSDHRPLSPSGDLSNKATHPPHRHTITLPPTAELDDMLDDLLS